MVQISNYSEPEDTQGDVLPEVEVVAVIVKDDLSYAGPNAKMPGRPMVTFEFQVTDGEFSGRHFWDRTMWINDPAGNGIRPDPNHPAGQRRINQYCMAQGIHPSNLGDTSRLFGVPMIIKLKVIPAKGEYRAKNEVSSVRSLNSVAPRQTAQTPAGGGIESRGAWNRARA